MLWIAAAAAASWTTDFSDGSAGDMTGATVEDGVLVVTERGRLDLEGLEALEGSLRIRLAEGDSFRVELGEGWWVDYDAGSVTLGETEAPLPRGHLGWTPDEGPTIQPGEDYWDGGNVLHCDVLEVDGTLYLYWTGEMASGYPYRQIGVATSTDGQTWVKHPQNPVLTIDYDTSTIDGIHVHMPTVLEEDGAWTMLYSCYQNNLGNRLCRATSEDGLSWTPRGIALDFGPTGTFDSGSLRMPEMWIDDDGDWQLHYNGTDPTEHYGPTGWATSYDGGVTWAKRGAITDDEHFLQGGGVLRNAYGLEQWFNVQDRFEHAFAHPDDPSAWTSTGTLMEKTELPDNWGGGYIQAPTMTTLGTTHHMWFNAYGADGAGEWHERLWHAESHGVSGAWFEVELRWVEDVLTVTWRDEHGLEASASAAAVEPDSLKIVTEGRVEVDELDLWWTVPETPDTGDTAPPDSDPPDSDQPVDSDPAVEEGPPREDPPPVTTEPGCGCSGSGGALGGLALVLLAGYLRRPHRREP